MTETVTPTATPEVTVSVTPIVTAVPTDEAQEDTSAYGVGLRRDSI